MHIIIFNKYSLSSLFRKRKKKAIENLKIYQKYQQQWSKEDEPYLSQSFSVVDDISKFQCANFELDDSESIKTLMNSLSWEPINISSNNNDEKSENDFNHNIILKNKIISLNDDYIALRSLGLEVKLSLLMSGESNLYIFTRCKQSEFSEATAICCISKELESARKFISFSILVKKDNDDGFSIRNLKKQEIPHQDNYIKTLDLSEIEFVFIDNGDNRCFVFLTKQDQNSNLLMLGDFYEPFLDKSNVMLGGSGDLISIKKMEIKQTNRDFFINYRNMNNENIQCCNIF